MWDGGRLGLDGTLIHVCTDDIVSAKTLYSSCVVVYVYFDFFEYDSFFFFYFFVFYFSVFSNDDIFFFVVSSCSVVSFSFFSCVFLY